MDFFNKAGAFKKMAELRNDMDKKRPPQQTAASVDHNSVGAFVASHRHASGSEVEILHLACSVPKP